MEEVDVLEPALLPCMSDTGPTLLSMLPMESNCCTEGHSTQSTAAGPEVAVLVRVVYWAQMMLSTDADGLVHKLGHRGVS